MNFLNTRSLYTPREKVSITRKMNNGMMIEDRISLEEVMLCGFTRIEILLPNGLEHWYVKDFESGIGVSKWYRGICFPKSNRGSDHGLYYGCGMVMLNMMGITNSVIKSYYAKRTKKEKLIKISWIDFAEPFVRYKQGYLLPKLSRFQSENWFDIQDKATESDTTITVALRLYYYNYFDRVRRDYQTYIGKSTRPVKLTPRTKNEKEEMIIEAKKIALQALFKDLFEIAEFNDISVDELQLIGCQ